VDADPTIGLDGGDALWLKIERDAAPIGCVICRCPACSRRQLATYRPASQKWPRCRACSEQARMIPVGDPLVARIARAEARKRRRRAMSAAEQAGQDG
jgi:hypothetical protein